jgi:hypothetical protein
VKIGQKPFGLVSMLESYNEVVTVAHDDYFALGLLLSPLLNPQVEYVMKVDIGQNGTDTAALNRTHLTLYPLPLFQHTRPQPFSYQAYDASVSDAVLYKLHQPSVVKGIEESTNVGIEHPVHLLRHQPYR